MDLILTRADLAWQNERALDERWKRPRHWSSCSPLLSLWQAYTKCSKNNLKIKQKKFALFLKLWMWWVLWVTFSNFWYAHNPFFSSDFPVQSMMNNLFFVITISRPTSSCVFIWFFFRFWHSSYICYIFG